MVPGARPIASSKASRPRATGSRWLTSSATRTVRLAHQLGRLLLQVDRRAVGREQAPSPRLVRRPRSTSTLSPGEVAANDSTRPPERVALTGLVESRLAGRGEEGAVRPTAPGERSHLAGDVGGRVEGHRRAERPRKLEPARQAVRDHHPGPRGAGDLHQQQADRALADDEDRLVLRDAGLPDGLEAGVHRLDEGGFPGAHPVRDRDRLPARRSSRERARTRHSRRPTARSRPWCRSSCRRGTARRAALAVEAGAARHVMVHDHALPFAKAARAPPERRDRPRDLVTEDERPRQQPVLDLLEIGRADPARVDPHQHLARPGLGHGHVLDAQVALAVINDGLHARLRVNGTGSATRTARSRAAPGAFGRSTGSSACRRARRRAR